MTKETRNDGKIPDFIGRQALLTALRNAKMARSAQAYVRGNTAQFYEWLQASDSKALPEGPPIWICGDCHTGFSATLRCAFASHVLKKAASKSRTGTRSAAIQAHWSDLCQSGSYLFGRPDPGPVAGPRSMGQASRDCGRRQSQGSTCAVRPFVLRGY